MIFFGKKKYSDEAEKFENFFRDVRKKMFEIKLKMRDEEGKTISTTDCEVIKFSSLNDAIYKHFGYSMKNSKSFTKDQVV
jgi:hypothetical protein